MKRKEKKEIIKNLKDAGLNDLEAYIALKIFDENINIDNMDFTSIITNIGEKPKFNE